MLMHMHTQMRCAARSSAVRSIATRALPSVRRVPLRRFASTCPAGLHIRLEDHVATIHFTEARRRNPLTRGILEGLHDFLSERQAAWLESRDDEVHVILIESDGPVFSSGHAFDDFVDSSPCEVRSLLELCATVNVLLREVPQPTVAAVAGSCLAGGAQLAASCDLLLAHRELATFCLPGTKGGGYCHTPSVAVAERVGTHKALELGLLGDVITADEAARIGLANRSIAAGHWDASVESIAHRLAAGYNRNLAEGKLTLYAQSRADTLSEKYVIATDAMVGMFGSEAWAAYMREFLARRKAKKLYL